MQAALSGLLPWVKENFLTTKDTSGSGDLPGDLQHREINTLKPDGPQQVGTAVSWP